MAILSDLRSKKKLEMERCQKKTAKEVTSARILSNKTTE